MASAQVEAFGKNSLTQAHGFEVGINRKTGLLLKSGRRFELRLYPGDRADVGLRVTLRLDFSLRNSVEKIDDDVEVEQLDHVSQTSSALFIPLFAHRSLQSQAIPLRWHGLALSPQSKTSASLGNHPLEHLADSATYRFCTTQTMGLGPGIQLADLRSSQFNNGSHDLMLVDK